MQPLGALTPKGLAQLASAKSLEELDLSDTAGALTSSAARAIAELPNLRVLTLAFNSSLDDAGMRALLGLPRLASLCVTHCPKLGANAFEPLRACRNLRLFSIHQESLGDAALEHIAAAGQLRELEIGHAAVTDRGLCELHRMRRLESLRIEFCRAVTKEGATALTAALPNCKIKVHLCRPAPPPNFGVRASRDKSKKAL